LREKLFVQVKPECSRKVGVLFVFAHRMAFNFFKLNLNYFDVMSLAD
jgi:hypothetical protein